MDKREVIKVVSRFRQEMEVRGIKLLKVILYGSYANDTNRNGSDIDIVVISEDFTDMDYWERIEIMADVIYEIFAPIEAVALTPGECDQGDSFIADFARKGEILFAA